MSKQQLKLLATATSEKPCQHKSLVQVEGELTEAQLEAIGFASARSAIAGGETGGGGWGGNHNETIVE